MLVIAIALLATGCNGQQEKNASSSKQDQKKVTKFPEPTVSWDVNKKFDENGNVVSYDSIYTWSYTNMDGDSVDVNVDSIREHFNAYLDSNLPSVWNKSFTQPMWNDSLFFNDILQDNYFHDRWQQDYFQMDEMFRHMDSLRNKFFYDRYPGILKPPPIQEEKN